jgi:hypothetical protein
MTVATSQRQVGFVDDCGTFTTVNPPGAAAAIVNAIGDRGEVAGFDVESSGVSPGFIYDDDTFTPLNVPGARLTVLHGIDRRNEVAGYCSDTSGAHGILYDTGNFTPLNAPVRSDIIAAAINDLASEPEPTRTAATPLASAVSPKRVMSIGQ